MNRDQAPLLLFLLSAMMMSVGAPASRADVKPGELIGPADVERVKDLVSPGIAWCIERGLQMRIIETQPIPWNAAYREATEKYSGQVQLAPDGRSVLHHVAGLPFPNIDPNDPQVALKIMWNYERKPYVTDDLDLRNFDADTGNITPGGLEIERHYLLDHLRTLFYTARLYVDPKPEIPNKEGIRGKGSLHPILEPFDLKGTGMTSIRYLDPDRQDDTWLYLAALRRVRRLSSAQRSDALFAQDTDVDSYGGYAGQIPWFEWKFLGERTMLASFHSEHFPVRYCAGGGDFVFCDNWEKRAVWVVEGTSTNPQYAYGKRLLFIDKETYLIAYSDIADRNGQLWKVWINQFGFRMRAAPTYGTTYPDAMPFNHSITMVDTQLEHATRAALPSHRFPGEEGWYYNQGEKTGLTPDFFTVAHLVAAGH